MTAPAGASVGIYVDLAAEVGLGDIIETLSGRRYLVTARRVQQRGKHTGRQHLRCVVMERGDPLPIVACDLRSHGGARCEGHSPLVHKIRWYPRGRGKR